MTRNVEILETAYQILIAENIDVVVQDCMIRYGEECQSIIEEARRFVEGSCKDVDREECINMIIREHGEKIARLVMERAGSRFSLFRPVIRYFNRNAHSPVTHGELKCVLSLCNIDADITELLRLGIIMHVNLDSVLVPHYLSLYDECSIDFENDVENVTSDPARAAILEGLIEGVRPIYEIFEKIYGVPPNDPALYNIGRICMYCEDIGRSIIHPCIDMYELRNLFHEIKHARARRLFRVIEPGMGHVKYSKKVGALISYVMLGPGEHGILMFMPWILPSRRLENYHSSSARIIITSVPFRREFAEYFHTNLEELKTFRNTAFLFVQEGLAYLVAPSKKSRNLDSLLDLIYRSGLEITEF